VRSVEAREDTRVDEAGEGEIDFHFDMLAILAEGDEEVV